MKLSYLVDYVRQLESVPVSAIREANERRLQELTIKVCNHPVIRFDDFAARLQQDKTQLDQEFGTVDQTIQDLKSHCYARISELEKVYYKNTWQWFVDQATFESQKPLAIDRKLNMTDQTRVVVNALISRYQDWRWPGMIVHPARESFVENMVALDPLYMVDTNLDLLKPALDRFHPGYQKRVAKYTVDEMSGEPLLAHLPQAQMGFCLIFHYFNFRPIEIIRRWLDGLWLLMRPGGRVAFTYNDCDKAHGIALSECYYMAYTPGSAIKSHAQQVGFEIVQDYHAPADVALLELLKPGTLSSTRGAQTLAKIVTKSK